MKKSKLLLLLCLFTAIVSCKKKEVSNLSEYYAYVSSYPDKNVSVMPNLQVTLNKTFDSSLVTNEIISITPKVLGDVTAKGNTILFKPQSPLNADEEYMVTLHLSKLYKDIPSKLKDFTFKVTTKKLLFTVSMQQQKMYDKNWNYIEGVINASDVIPTDKLKNVLKATCKGKKLLLKFETNEAYVQRIHFKVDSIQREQENKELKISWNGSDVDSKSKGERTFEIVGKNNFKVLDVKIVNDDSQYLEISFSDPLKKNQNLNGLIQFLNTSRTRYTYKVNSNIVRVFPSAAIKNEFVLKIHSGLKNNEGVNLKQSFRKSLYFEELKPGVSFIKSGTILPNSDNLKINFQAVNLRAVDVTVYKIFKDNVLQFLQNNKLGSTNNLRYVGRPVSKYTVNLSNQGLLLNKKNAFAVNLSDFVTVENGAMYRVEIAAKKEYSNYNCGGKSTTKIKFGKQELKTEKYDNTSYYYDDYDYDYRWSERKDPCKSSYYADKKISTNILATNLGVTVKKGNNNNIFVAVSNILSTNPEKGATVNLYNLQQQEIASSTTNSDGVAQFNDANQAFFAVVSNKSNATYIKLNDGEALSMSKFDVSGSKLQQGIKGFIYGERGVWRPGDQLFLTFVLNDKANPIPQKHPIKFELINPHGKIINRQVLYKNPSNVYTFAPKTTPNALTGNWNVKVTVGGAKFNKALKIETIKPNRLKIKLTTQQKELAVNQPIKGDVAVKWLHGAIAKNLKLDINAKFRQTKTAFKTFKNYHFDDVTRAFNTEEVAIYQGRLNEKGTVSFSTKPSLKAKAPGKLKATFITKVYEEGGDFSTDVFSRTISPYTKYVGLEVPQEPASNYYLHTDKAYNFNVATVNPKGKPVKTNSLKVQVYKLNWRWWWNNSDSNLSRYDGAQELHAYKQLYTTTKTNGKGTFSLKIDKNDWGRFLVKVTDSNGKHATSKIVYFDWPSWYGSKGNNSSQASMLVFSTDKKEYKVGDMAKVKIPSSEGSRALITVENGTEVLDYFWTETKDKQTEFELPILKTYTPNVYINVSLLQPHSQTTNDLPIRMYGSTPILVTDAATKLTPEILMAKEIRPESTAKIRVQEKNGKPMTYTIALVDEGLLDLTRFKTPNPWSTFYARQSLGVKTWDVFDDVIGAYGGKINQVLSVGGDEAEAGSKNKKANRFKPMVTYLGPFTLEKGGRKDHEIAIPKYIGAVKAMVVASDTQKEAYGSAEKTAFVRKPVMILASLPRKITPNETVTLPVTVFAMKPNIKNVKVKIKENPSFTVVGNKTQNVSFNNPDEKMTYFQLKVNDFTGIGKVAIEASSGVEKAAYEVEIDVVNPNPITTEVKELVLQKEEHSEINFETFGTKGTNNATIEFSTVPPMNFTKRLQYLIRYPHGCVEQTTSGVFPQLFLNDLFDLPEDKKQSLQRNIKAGINRLASFQLPNGGLSYWQGGSYVTDWGTSYVGHFMIEAANKGYALPIGFMDGWTAYQKQEARNWRNKYSSSGLQQAYRLYTLALAKSPDLASMNRLRETSNISNDAKLRLAATYALIGKSSVAKSILNSVTVVNYEKSNYYGYGSALRNKALALETYTAVKDDLKAVKLAKDIAEGLSSNQWMSTQTSAYSLLAIAKYALQNGANSGIKADYKLNTNKHKATTNKTLYSSTLKELQKNNTVKINNKGKGVLYARIFVNGVLPVGQEKVIQRGLTASTVYKSKNNSTIEIDKLEQGTNFVAQVTIKNTTNKTVENVALTQILPSGWEVINSRFTDFGNTQSTKVDYTDIRDDRVNYYFTIKAGASKTFQILLNASYLGSYYLPGVQCEAMYDNDYMVRTDGRWIKVVK